MKVRVETVHCHGITRYQIVGNGAVIVIDTLDDLKALAGEIERVIRAATMCEYCDQNPGIWTDGTSRRVCDDCVTFAIGELVKIEGLE